MAGVPVPDTITCIDCGETAGRLSHPPPEEGFAPGDVVAYRCGGCGERFDVVVPDEADEGGEDRLAR